MSYATILIPGSGVVAAYGTDTQEFANALGLYLITWFIFTTILMYVYPGPFFLRRALRFLRILRKSFFFVLILSHSYD